MSSVAMISVEMKIKEAINELKRITPPVRPCLFKICAEKHSIKTIRFWLVIVEEKSASFYSAREEGCQLISKTLKIIIHLFSSYEY